MRPPPSRDKLIEDARHALDDLEDRLDPSAPPAPPKPPPAAPEPPAPEPPAPPKPAAAPPAPEPKSEASAPKASPPASGDESAARLVAMKMALDGTSRDDVRAKLAADYSVEDLDGLLDDVFAKAGKYRRRGRL